MNGGETDKPQIMGVGDAIINLQHVITLQWRRYRNAEHLSAIM